MSFHQEDFHVSKKDIYPENKGMDKKRTKKLKKAHPPESPLNGGINLTIPLLGGVPFYGGEGAFIFLKDYPEKKRKKHK
jgi:hypothetical protein